VGIGGRASDRAVLPDRDGGAATNETGGEPAPGLLVSSRGALTGEIPAWVPNPGFRAGTGGAGAPGSGIEPGLALVGLIVGATTTGVETGGANGLGVSSFAPEVVTMVGPVGWSFLTITGGGRTVLWILARATWMSFSN
jgi:hypothetical protein